jgi:nitrite reductase (NADH) large subunit
MKPLRAVIIGNGIAGVTVAARLRQLEPDPARLVVEIYTREPYEYYSRIRIPEVFLSRLSAMDLEVYAPEWYRAKRINVYKNQEVQRIDRPGKKIVIRGGVEVAYDRLVLCMGADSRKPPIPNGSLDGIFTVREYGDAETIRNYMRAGTRHAVVLGGGLLGLEAARHLHSPALERLTIIEIEPRLLPRQLDEPGARLLKAIVERLPADVILGSRVQQFLGERRVTGLRLADGRELPAETVLISAGIQPRVGLARQAGLAVNWGVVVDSFLRSSDPDIFAAGDLAEFEGIVWGIIPAALDHAPIVANNLLHRPPLAYRQTIPQNTLKVAGIHLTSIGRVNLEPPSSAGRTGAARQTEEGRYRAIARLDEEGERYEKYVLEQGRLVGSILLGSRENLPFVHRTIGRETTVEEIEARLRWYPGPAEGGAKTP